VQQVVIVVAVPPLLGLYELRRRPFGLWNISKISTEITWLFWKYVEADSILHWVTPVNISLLSLLGTLLREKLYAVLQDT